MNVQTLAGQLSAEQLKLHASYSHKRFLCVIRDASGTAVAFGSDKELESAVAKALNKVNNPAEIPEIVLT